MHKDHEHGAAHVRHRARHLAFRVHEHAQPRDLLDDVAHVVGRVVRARPQVHEQALADGPDDVSAHHHIGPTDSLNDGAHEPSMTRAPCPSTPPAEHMACLGERHERTPTR